MRLIHANLVVVAICAAICAEVRGAISTIALTGNDAPGIAGAKFAAFTAGPLNDSGALVFTAQLQNGVGGVVAGNDNGVWRFDGSTTTLLAREGIANVSGAPGATFQTFNNLAIDTTGGAVVRAALTEGVGGVAGTNKDGVWRYDPGGAAALVLRAGAGGVPGVSGADFGLLPTAIHLGDDGRLVLDAKMAPGVGGVSNNTDSGLWRYDASTATLIARESTMQVPGMAATFQTFLPPRVNANQEFVVLATLNYFGDININNDFGIWRYNDVDAELIVRKGISPVPGAPDTTFYHFHDAAINAPGQIAFSATLNHGGAVGPDNDDGIWLFSETTGALVAQNGSGGVPGAPGANFSEFDPPLLNDAGEVLVKAHLAVGPGGVTAANELGLWRFDDGASHLVAQTGSGNVPGAAGTSFLSFERVALNALGFTAVEATLAPGGTVNPSNDRGLWLLGHSGGGRLIAREGGSLAGRTIASLAFVGAAATSESQPSGLNDAGQVLFQASFTSGESGLFLYTWRDGDFNSDGNVDGADLGAWESAMGNSAAGDADLDGDSDGLDFLIWQRQYGTGIGPATDTIVVPEPSSSGLACCLAIVLLRAYRRRMLEV